jgi:hypothetical protein
MAEDPQKESIHDQPSDPVRRVFSTSSCPTLPARQEYAGESRPDLIADIPALS